jgi:hypothetical protein
MKYVLPVVLSVAAVGLRGFVSLMGYKLRDLSKRLDVHSNIVKVEGASEPEGV